MHVYIEPYSPKEVVNVSSLVAVEQTVDIKGKKCLISNTGAQPAYFKEKNIDGIAATTANSMLIPAGEVFPVILTGDVFSFISNATGTNLALLILDQ